MAALNLTCYVKGAGSKQNVFKQTKLILRTTLKIQISFTSSLDGLLWILSFVSSLKKYFRWFEIQPNCINR